MIPARSRDSPRSVTMAVRSRLTAGKPAFPKETIPQTQDHQILIFPDTAGRLVQLVSRLSNKMEQQPQSQQQQQQPSQRGTPARRRAKRPVNSPARRTYASENDMPSEPVFPIELAQPFTPQKSASNSPAPTTQPNQSKSRPRNANKGRAKQVASPGPAKHGRTTPPQTIAPKPVAAAAFAGATFHASPAPSSLPIPSFLAKALDSPSVQESDCMSREPSPPATDSEAPTPQNKLLAADVSRQESPLDIFFRADRAEKERARRASSANILGPTPVPFSPPAQIRAPVEPKTLPSGLSGAGNRRPGFQRNSSTGIPTSELDGTPGTSVGPAFARSYQDRIRAARAGERQQQHQQQQQQVDAESRKPAASQQQESDPTDMSERLKRFLSIPSATPETSQAPPGSRAPFADISPTFHGSGPHHPVAQPPSASTASATDSLDSASRSPLGPPLGVGPPHGGFNAPPSMFTPYHHQHHPQQTQQSPSAPMVTSPQGSDVNNSRSPEILHMEDSLRRILKLNLGPAPAQAGHAPTDYRSS